jgi:YhcN/YlaJ family sporulation lipoprotein
MKKILLTAVILLILSSCNTNKNIQNNVNQQSVNVKNSNIQNVDRKTGQEISKHLVTLATSIPNVHDATAVVLGRYAIVGIDVNAKIDRSQVGSIKYSVAEALRKDPHGANAVVIADPDTNQRLKNISAEIQKGKPIQGIMNELADIAGRLMPEIPGNLLNPTPKTGTEDQKTKLPENERKDLDQQQEKQSNYQKSKP